MFLDACTAIVIPGAGGLIYWMVVFPGAGGGGGGGGLIYWMMVFY